MKPSPTTVGQTGALQPERDALEVGKMPGDTEKAHTKATVH